MTCSEEPHSRAKALRSMWSQHRVCSRLPIGHQAPKRRCERSPGSRNLKGLAALAVLATLAGCSATPLRYYQAQVAPDVIAQSKSQLPIVLLVTPFSADQAYDDPRIVYRESAHRLDYYHFHRWSSEPGEMCSVVLREAYRKSGAFAGVVAGLDTRVDHVLSGRVLAIEEVDRSDKEWEAHVAVELTLSARRSGKVLWTTRVDEREPLKERSPEGLAESVGVALTRIARVTTPQILGAVQRSQ